MIRSCAVAVAVCLGLTAPAAAQQAAFTVDTAASRVRVELGRAGLLKFLGHGHTIEAPLTSGSIEADAGNLARCSVRLSWQAARLAVVPGSEPADDIPEVEKRMRGADVLDVASHAGIAFESSAVSGELAAPGEYRLRVRGALRLKGRAYELEVPLDVDLRADALVARGEVKLRLRDLGLAPPSVAGLVKVANDFQVSFEIHARPRGPAGAPQRVREPPR